MAVYSRAFSEEELPGLWGCQPFHTHALQKRDSMSLMLHSWSLEERLQQTWARSNGSPARASLWKMKTPTFGEQIQDTWLVPWIRRLKVYSEKPEQFYWWVPHQEDELCWLAVEGSSPTPSACMTWHNCLWRKMHLPCPCGARPARRNHHWLTCPQATDAYHEKHNDYWNLISTGCKHSLHDHVHFPRYFVMHHQMERWPGSGHNLHW